MGVLNSSVFNGRAYNQHVQSGSLPSNVQLDMFYPPKVGLFNALPHNAVALNGATPVPYITGGVIITVSLTKAVRISNVSSNAVGVKNSVPLNSLAYNSAVAADNNTGKALVAATLGIVLSSIQANMLGSALLGGSSSIIAAAQSGGYNSVPYLSGPFNDASQYEQSGGAVGLPELMTGLALDFVIHGSGDITSKPWLQPYNPTSIQGSGEGALLYSQGDAVYLSTI